MPLVFLIASSMVLASPEAAYEKLDFAVEVAAAGDIDAARRLVDEALELDPQNTEALALSAKLAELSGDLDAAERELQTLLSLDPQDDAARFALARVLNRRGKRVAAAEVNDALLERHPQHVDALLLRRSIRAGREPYTAEETSTAPFAPFVRVDVSTGYDSNPTLRGDPAAGSAFAVESGEGAPVLSTDAAIGLSAGGDARPWTALATVRNTRAISPESSAPQDSLASSIGAAAIARRGFGGGLLGTLDLRYQALYTDGFGNFIQHYAAPSILGAYDLGDHTLRALVGFELRKSGDYAGINDSVAPRVALRDTWTVADFMVIADLGARTGIDLGDSDDPGSAFVGSQELSGLLFAQWQGTEALSLFAGSDLRWRAFDDFLTARPDGTSVVRTSKETVLRLFAGVRYRFDVLELHAEYGFGKAFAGRLRAYERHQATAGVRVWYY